MVYSMTFIMGFLVGILTSIFVISFVIMERCSTKLYTNTADKKSIIMTILKFFMSPFAVLYMAYANKN